MKKIMHNNALQQTSLLSRCLLTQTSRQFPLANARGREATERDVLFHEKEFGFWLFDIRKFCGTKRDLPRKNGLRFNVNLSSYE